jgi:hypothetical protein
MGLERTGRWLDWLQRIQAVWNSFPVPVQTAIWSSILIAGTWLSGRVESLVSNSHLVRLRGRRFGNEPRFCHRSYLRAAAFRARQGPPPPPPEEPRPKLEWFSGNPARVEVFNEGGAGKIRVVGKILGVRQQSDPKGRFC